jgi:hypothetical protein
MPEMAFFEGDEVGHGWAWGLAACVLFTNLVFPPRGGRFKSAHLRRIASKASHDRRNPFTLSHTTSHEQRVVSRDDGGHEGVVALKVIRRAQFPAWWEVDKAYALKPWRECSSSQKLFGCERVDCG